MAFTKETASVNGRKGGLATKARMLAKNPEYYSGIGYDGGVSLFKQRGSDYYSNIGKLGIGKLSREQRQENARRSWIARKQKESLLKGDI